VTAVVCAEAEGWPDWRVIHLERRDRHPAFLEHHSLIHVLGEDDGAVGRSRSSYTRIRMSKS
jgi:hypothetical protein